MGLVFRPGPGPQRVAPILRVDRGPAVAEIAEIESALPAQPLRVAVVLAGDRETAGWWGPGRPAGWQDAIEAAREVLRVSRASFRIEADQYAPWHPGRCAAVYVTGDGRRPGPRRATPANCTPGCCKRSSCRSGSARRNSTCR